MASLLTAGHGTASQDELAALLVGADVGLVCDIRRFPGSRHNPAVARDALGTWLPQHGIAYQWDPRLGGRRRVPAGQDPTVDGWWRVTAFRAYAAHMRTPEFADGMAGLLRLAAADRTLILCSEAVWWRCHRRLVADALTLLHDTPVHHLMHDGTVVAHRPSEGARVTADGLRYDVAPAPSTRVPVS